MLLWSTGAVVTKCYVRIKHKCSFRRLKCLGSWSLADLRGLLFLFPFHSQIPHLPSFFFEIWPLGLWFLQVYSNLYSYKYITISILIIGTQGRRRRQWKDGCRHDSDVATRQESQRLQKATRSQKEARKNSPLELPEGLYFLPISWFWSFDWQNCKRIKFYCFKTSNLW